VIRRSGLQALRALLELGREPGRWRSGADLAASQQLPAPTLEQLLLQLRRAGLVEARRGRNGGYRLRRPAAQVSLARALAAVDAHPGAGADHQPAGPDAAARNAPVRGAAVRGAAEEQVTEALQQRLRLALDRELQRLTLEDLQFDLQSARAAQSEEGGLLLG
jgi:Rrf2 family iron-sulfur cluster assembly transcriptional regulator